MASIPPAGQVTEAKLPTTLLPILGRGLAVLLAPFAVHAVLAQRGGVPFWLAQGVAAGQVAAMAWVMAGIVTGLAGRTRLLAAAAAAGVFLVIAAAAGRSSLIVAAALWHGAIYLGLGLLFGLSLRPGQEALVSRLARRVEPCPTPALLAYARGVTWLWAGFCAAQLAVSALLLAVAPLTVWSDFVNVLGAPLVGLTFAAEYAVRRWRFRHLRLASLAGTVRAFGRRNAPDDGTASGVVASRG
jgi:uncharacterized membrane protein